MDRSQQTIPCKGPKATPAVSGQNRWKQLRRSTANQNILETCKIRKAEADANKKDYREPNHGLLLFLAFSCSCKVTCVAYSTDAIGRGGENVTCTCSGCYVDHGVVWGGGAVLVHASLSTAYSLSGSTNSEGSNRSHTRSSWQPPLDSHATTTCDPVRSKHCIPKQHHHSPCPPGCTAKAWKDRAELGHQPKSLDPQ